MRYLYKVISPEAKFCFDDTKVNIEKKLRKEIHICHTESVVPLGSFSQITANSVESSVVKKYESITFLLVSSKTSFHKQF